MANSDGYPWESNDDRIEYTRVFIPSRIEQIQMAAALQIPALRSQEIRRQLMTPIPMPPRYAYGGRGTDILTCWEQPQTAPVHSIMDYTNDEAGLQSTARPSLGQW
jgi:hypothetical protein